MVTLLHWNQKPARITLSYRELPFTSLRWRNKQLDFSKKFSCYLRLATFYNNYGSLIPL